MISGGLAALITSLCLAGLALAQEPAPQPPTVDLNRPEVLFGPTAAPPGRAVALAFQCETDGAILRDSTDTLTGSRSSVLKDISLKRNGKIYTGTARVAAGAEPGSYSHYAVCPIINGPADTYVQAGQFTVLPDTEPAPQPPPVYPTKDGLWFAPEPGALPGRAVALSFRCETDAATLSERKEWELFSQSSVLKDIVLKRDGGSIYTGSARVAPDAKPGRYEHYVKCPGRTRPYVQSGTFTVLAEPGTSTPKPPSTPDQKPEPTPNSTTNGAPTPATTGGSPEPAPQPPVVGLSHGPYVFFGPVAALPGRAVAVSFQCGTDGAILADVKDWAKDSHSSVLKDIALTRNGTIYTGTMRVAPDARPGQYTHYARCMAKDDSGRDYGYYQAGTFTVLPDPGTSTPNSTTGLSSLFNNTFNGINHVYNVVLNFFSKP